MIALGLITAALCLLVVAWRKSRRPALSGAVRNRPAPARRPVRADVPHLLYCYRRPDGRRIYGGISNEPAARHARHLVDPDDRWWMGQSDGVMYPIRWLPGREVARRAERALVREMYFRGEDPANYHHNPGRRRAVHR